MKLISPFILILVTVCSLSAQHSKEFFSTIKIDSWKKSFSEQRMAVNNAKINRGNLHIVAIMVEFQPDSNRFTTGNGTFNPDYLDTTSVKIDPLPHNQAYFEAHLAFVKHYFETASKNRLSVSSEVLPTVYRLDEEMAFYSPTGEDDSQNYKLGYLLKDTWEKVHADATVSTANWDNNTLFILFHAGAGRDFDFLNTTLDRTPQDIPSLYLNLNGIRSLTGNAAFNGYSVKGFSVKNTGILPETQSRTGSFLEEEYILQLAINGFVTAVAGNHIGLPDLYNTQTGSSAIGRFGLMDPEGFFAYFGLFPPLPSAWERYYMEWDSAIDVNHDEASPINLSAVSLSPNNGMAKVLINADEYFLIENRHRNPAATGITITVQQANGIKISKTFTSNDTRFTGEDSDSLLMVLPKGVITEVSNYDWALPGGLDAGNDGKYRTADDRLLNGGMLIWHIDESVINSQIGQNRVNANSGRRGVFLVEADGAQDIGNATNNIFLSNVVGGTAFDFWWSGNNYTVITERGDSIRVYENRFAPDTRPSTKTNSGSYNPIELYDFSANAPVSSFKIRPFVGELILDTRFINRNVNNTFLIETNAVYPREPLFYVASADSFLIIPSESGLSALPFEPSISETSFRITNSVFRQPIVYQNQLIVAISDTEIESYSWLSNNWQKNWTTSLPTSLTSGISITNSMIDIEMSSYMINPGDGLLITNTSKDDLTSALVNGKQATLRSNVLSFTGGSYSIPSGAQFSSTISLKGISIGSSTIWQLRTDNSTHFVNEDIENEIRTVHSDWSVTIKNDSPNFFAVSSTDSGDLNGLYSNGTIAAYFPFSILVKTILGTPLFIDLNGDESQEIVFMAKDSLAYSIYAYDSKFVLVDGFPIPAGTVHSGETPISPIFASNRLWVVHTNGTIQSWIFSESGSAHFSSHFRSDGKRVSTLSENNDFVNTNNLLNTSETYNWPNPANEETHLRYATRDEAEIIIDLFTISGKKVWENKLTSKGKTPEEILLNTSTWGSGLYYVRIQAKKSGETDSKIVKMMVEH
ncbi:MAG: T9SS type A sorting domain-containing protein [Bacteroidetes bacterium]|nr:T9SS type A sorting domain-containing protein [Bacteroidota bacterium]